MRGDLCFLIWEWMNHICGFFILFSFPFLGTQLLTASKDLISFSTESQSLEPCLAQRDYTFIE